MGDIRQGLWPTWNSAAAESLSKRTSESSAQRNGGHTRRQPCVDASLNAGKPAARRTTREVFLHEQVNLCADRFDQRVEQCLSNLFAIHRVSPIISPSATRARC